MSVVVSLLRAIDRADGEALVMHVGEKPYVITAQGPAEIAAKALTVNAMTGMLEQLLPADSRQALNEVGAVEYHLPADEAFPGMRFSVVAARGGDDIWIEVRRRKEVAAPTPVFVEEPVAVGVSHGHEARSHETHETQAHETHEIRAHETHETYGSAELPAIEAPPPVAEPAQFEVVTFEPVDAAPIEPPPVEAHTDEWSPVLLDEPEPVAIIEEPAWQPQPIEEPEPVEEPGDGFALRSPSAEDFPEPAPLLDEDQDVAAPEALSGPAFDFSAPEPELVPDPVPEPVPELASEPKPEPELEPDPVPAAVVPMARVNLRLETPPRQAHVDPLHHLLQVGATHGASALYVAAQAKPSLRVDGEIHVLDEAPLTEAELEAGLRALLGSRAQTESFPLGDIEPFDVPSVGRVHYFGFRDHRGLGAVFKMLPARAVSAQHVGLSSPIQALCTEPEGLVIVAGAHSAGKSTLVAALTDQINRTRRDHVITVENQIQFVHENQNAFVSQREARDERHFVEAVHTAIKEAPDVLVIDHVMNADVARAALDAAVNGHMVVVAVTANSTAGALERFIEFFGDDRAEARQTVAEHLRGVIMQTLLRKTGGGRAAAREVLVNVPSVGTLIAEGQFDQLGSVMNGGRRVGMVPLNDALLALVQNGSLDVRQAYRKSPDQTEFVTMLGKAGIDTSFAERLS